MSLIKIYVCDICGCQEPAITDLENGHDEWWPNKWIGLEDNKYE